MKVNNPNSGRCWVFKNLAIEIWDKIVSSHKVGIEPGEDGITRDLMAAIRQFHSQNRIGLDVYVKPGYNENVYGSDMDLFVEVAHNQYVWYALQAKILKRNGRYDTFRDGHRVNNPTYQWEKLNHLKSLVGCEGFFLLYNGKDDYEFNGTDICNRKFNKKQFGCSILALSYAETLALKTSNYGRYNNPTFEDIHPRYAEPWRVLVCCNEYVRGLTRYSLETILEANRITDYNKIEFGPVGGIGTGPIDSTNEIVNSINKADWNADYRMIVKLEV